MVSIEQPCYTLIHVPTDGVDVPNELDLKKMLEHGEVKAKMEALKHLIYMQINGEKLPAGMLMTVIKIVMPTRDNQLKKLCQFFWEVVPKYGPDGKLLSEMILVCESFRGDLKHPNEFVRGSTLRFLCKIKEPDLLEPLMNAIRTCLSDKHSYVKRNAVLAIFTIYKNFENLIPDAPDLIGTFLEEEKDASCKRNAFIMLLHVDQERALSYLQSCIDQVTSFNDILQLVIVELIYKVCHANPSERSRFIRCIYNLLNSSSSAVRFEAASTLLSLTAAPTATKAVANAYIDLIVKESDNNVKLIVLNKLIDMRDGSSKEKVLQEMIMDIMRILSASDIEVRRKTLHLCLDLVTSRTIQEMLMYLKKEIVKTSGDQEPEDAEKYRQLLVRVLHQCTLKFPDFAHTVIPVLAEFLGDKAELAAQDVLVFFRDAISKFKHLEPLVLKHLMDALTSIKNVNIFRSTIWILGEFTTKPNDIDHIVHLLKECIGGMPIVDDEIRIATGVGDDDKPSATAETPKASQARKVTADGTYAKESALISSNSVVTKDRPSLRKFLLQGKFYVAAMISAALCKVSLRYFDSQQIAESRKFRLIAECMYISASIMHFGRTSMPEKKMTEDDYEFMFVCIRIMSERLAVLKQAMTSDCRDSLALMLDVTKVIEKPPVAAVKVHTDDALNFLQLMAKNDVGDSEDLFDFHLVQAIQGTKKDDPLASGSKLSKVSQLTGFSDPVYAEAYVNVNQYDIVLDVFIVNQSDDVLQNLTLELATVGDLKIVEKPPTVVLGGHDFINMKASIKVTSTENGVIFGNIVYDIKGAASDRCCVVLNDIQIDIMDYIIPAKCSDQEFRTMWSEFEWENKININTSLINIRDYMKGILKATNMACLTPEAALAGDCGFLTANLYAKSIFGEDVLANLSVEQSGDASASGHIRIRAKSQGMALSMGEKMNTTQKAMKPAKQ